MPLIRQLVLHVGRTRVMTAAMSSISSMLRTELALVFAAFLLAAAPAWAAQPAATATAQHHEQKTPAETLGYVEGAQALESRLLAPCCWTQTLDIHGSEIAQELRKEIRTRLQAGESPNVIEASIVARYGERIRAVPKSSPLGKTGSILLVSMLLAGVGAVWLLVRWRRRSIALALAEEAEQKEAPASDGSRDRYDQQIDAELERM